MSEITALNRKRGNLKGQITRLLTYLAEEAKMADITELEMKIANAAKIEKNLHELIGNYYEIVEDEDLEELEKKFQDIQADVEGIQIGLNRFLKHLKNDEMLNGESKRVVKLPEIQLPKFNGNYEQWYLFKSQFDSLIDDNVHLSKSQKLFYLQSALEGNAKQIQSMEDTYSSLYQALESRYQNKRLIVDAHINDILMMDKIHSESAIELRSLIDKLLKNLRALKLMKLETNALTEIMLMNIIRKNLDKETRRQLEMNLSSIELPNWEEFIEFLQKRCQTLENLQDKDLAPTKLKFHTNKQNRVFKNFLVKPNLIQSSCKICKEQHPIFKCSKFISMSIKQRFEFVKRNDLCINCLSAHHKVNECKAKANCSVCNKRHNSMLHFPNKTLEVSCQPLQGQLNPNAEEYERRNSNELSHTLSCINRKNKTVILPTVVVWVFNPIVGSYHKARAILDTGSMSNIITTEFASRLGVPRKGIHIVVSSLSGKETMVKSKLHATILNGNGSFSTTLDFLVVNKITDFLPVARYNLDNLEIPQQLADPQFGVPAKVDMLIGAQASFEILQDGQIRVPNSSLMFRNSVFGYVATGAMPSDNPKQYCGLLSQQSDIDDCLQKFWQIENLDETAPVLSKEEEYCEEHYQLTHRRDSTGRYVVQMATKGIDNLGDSRKLAEIRLNQLWRRLTKNEFMKELYLEFMQQYIDLDHMEKVEDTNAEPSTNSTCYYLPHHGVFRPDNQTTKLRVVFNASAATTSGLSLNDLLLKGTVKEDIFEIMTRFRKHKFAFTADIQKMFRQVLIDPKQRDFLRILWKTKEEMEPVTYRLKTVTYGTASAPYLAVRTLKQLALDEKARFPLASKVILQDVYMDDIVSGAQSLDTARELQRQLRGILETCGMTLHKWHSNTMQLMNSIPTRKSNLVTIFSTTAESTVKTLGVIWKPEEDQFLYKVTINDKLSYTKREVLSVIARLYDPLGLLGPVITKAKIFLQKLWIRKINWEDEIPEPIATEWKDFVFSLKLLENITIDRFLLADSYQQILLLGFADASEAAYGAVVYLQCICGNNKVSSKIIASKSRVAPIRVLSIPRLELCACLLLSQLVKRIHLSLKMHIDEVRLHSDSMICLAWISIPANKLKSFVGNRVSKIQTMTEVNQWRHIPSSLNPADIISRGVNPRELISKKLWWNGPQIQMDDTPLPASNDLVNKMSADEYYNSELKPHKDINLMSSLNNNLEDFLEISNSYMKLIRILSFVFRFLYNARNVTRKTGPLTNEELQGSKLYLIKRVQEKAFGNELCSLKKGEPYRGGQFSNLNPFVDQEGILRVGGRLTKADHLTFNQKFPILLPKDDKLTLAIIRHYHIKYLHIGAQTLLYLVRQQFWPMSGRNTARKIVHECVVCFKNKPKGVEQIMGDLPSERVVPSSPFTHVGIDFCGPFSIKYKGQRKGIYQKCYVALFICFITKAIHLEVVTDLTSAAMIATLRRFFSRRGKCKSICTDNATNFVGARSELKSLYNHIRVPSEALANYLTNEEITWKFIPPRSPNFGGLWESGIKSFKYLLKRSIGNSRLTFEQFLTVITQIEGILNSRPLSPMSSDPTDFEALTPGHFLIGRPLTSLPESDLTEKGDNYLSQWQKLSKIVQLIWRKWNLNYLNNLQARTKWQFDKQNVTPNSMVLIREDNLPPGKWTMGRIQEVIPGSDGKVRVVLVKTPQGVFKRSISKLCLLPCT